MKHNDLRVEVFSKDDDGCVSEVSLTQYRNGLDHEVYVTTDQLPNLIKYLIRLAVDAVTEKSRMNGEQDETEIEDSGSGGQCEPGGQQRNGKGDGNPDGQPLCNASMD